MANEARPCPCDLGDKMEYGSLGEEVQIEHVKAYVVKPNPPTDKAVIVIQDIFGWQLPNTRYMADMLAANGYVAVCPDFFLGKEPWSPSSDWSTFQEWLEDKKPTNINKEVEVVLRYLKEQSGVKRIGVVGFCWGGVATHYIALQYPDVKAGVSVYAPKRKSESSDGRASMKRKAARMEVKFDIVKRSEKGGTATDIGGIVREREDRYDLKSPTLFIFGEKDTVIPLDQVTTLEAKLKDKCAVDFKVKVFPDQTHGFVHRKREDINPADRPYILEAREDMINWLNTYM